MVLVDKINRSGNLVNELCRDGNAVNKAYRSGELIYQRCINHIVDYSDYLTFNIISGGTINWRLASDTEFTPTPPLSIDYKINNGDWITITASTGSSAPYFTVNAGDSVSFRGDNKKYTIGYTNEYHTFSGSTAYFNAEGNIMSLIDKTEFSNMFVFEESSVFVHLFSNTNIVKANNLLLPVTSLTNNCYGSMFSNCASLTTAPELPAEIVSGITGCYQNMFDWCGNLNYIKCLAISTANVGTQNWVRGVSPTGTFVKAASMNDWQTGDNGIPEGWTVINA